MPVKIYNLVSPLHDHRSVEQSQNEFISGLENAIGDEIIFAGTNELSKTPIPVVFVRTGGVESEFAKTFQRIRGPFILLTVPSHNSLPAAMEILTYIRSTGRRGEIIHGTTASAGARLRTILRVAGALSSLGKMRLGVIGKPSDWLIGSTVAYAVVKKIFGTELVDIRMDETIEAVRRATPHPPGHEAFEMKKAGITDADISSALAVHRGLKTICDRHRLDGFTIRCFDLLGELRTTGCLALAMMNEAGVHAGCEGDVPALLSMIIAKLLSGQSPFMANPAALDVTRDRVTLAHCTVPFGAAGNYRLTTHFESGIGVGVRGEFPAGPATIFKLSPDLNDFFVSRAAIISNPSHASHCRTQVEASLTAGVDYFLKKPFGNHHIMVPGDHTDIIREFMDLAIG